MLVQLAQETTLQAGFIFANEHLSALASVDFATEATLDKIATATERTAAVPIVDALLEVGLAAIPTDPSDPTNQLLTDFTSTIGGAGAGLLFDIQTAREYGEGSIMRGDVDMSLMPGSTADNPAFVSLVNASEIQKVEVVGGSLDKVGSVGEVSKTVKIAGDVNAKQVGVVQVSQSGQWVMQLASGETVPVYVTGGQLVADLAGGLEGLAVALADEEIRLSAVGAL